MAATRTPAAGHVTDTSPRPVDGVTRRSAIAAGASAIAFAAGAARAQEQPIIFISGAAAGGAIDAYARIIADHMSRTLGRGIIFEARAGAGGNIAAQQIAAAPADGSLVWVGTMAMTEINPLVYSKIAWSMKDFRPLIKGIEAPLVFVTHPSVPARTLDEFIAWAKPQRGKLSYASFSPGTPSHFLGALMSDKFGLDLTHVPYRGSGPQTNDLVAGHVQFGFTQMQGALPQFEAGRLRAIATTSETRFRLTPDTPTFAELGHPDFNTSIWFGLLVKAGTPEPVYQRLLEAARAAHADEGVRKALAPQGFEISGQTGEDFRRSIEAGSARWEKLVKATGFKAD
jgi:tripartite-type tricarboxylate transporter receptor subunit TctC